MLARMVGNIGYLKCIKDTAALLPRHCLPLLGEGGSERSGEPDEVFIMLTKRLQITSSVRLRLTASPQGEANDALH